MQYLCHTPLKIVFIVRLIACHNVSSDSHVLWYSNSILTNMVKITQIWAFLLGMLLIITFSVTVLGQGLWESEEEEASTVTTFTLFNIDCPSGTVYDNKRHRCIVPISMDFRKKRFIWARFKWSNIGHNGINCTKR